MSLRRSAPILLCLSFVACSADKAVNTPAQAAGCTSPAKTTGAETEGPYYKAGPPRRKSFVNRRTKGRRLVLSGRVRSTSCKPLAGARVDFWQADAAGSYDNSGYRMRGYQLTDSHGRYRLSTVVPGEYPGRTKHIHVKVTPRGGSVLTSQLYIPGVARNKSDQIFDSRNLVRLNRSHRVWRAGYDFVVR
jgi:protocatechuate 3,4-dioxygenase beta subunit